MSRRLKVDERGRPRTRSHRRYHTETKHRHDDNNKNPHQGAMNQPKEQFRGLTPSRTERRVGLARFLPFLRACLARDLAQAFEMLRARDRSTSGVFFWEQEAG